MTVFIFIKELTKIYDFQKELLKYGLTPDIYEQVCKDISNKIEGINDLDWSEIKEKYNIQCAADTIRKSSTTIFGGQFRTEYLKSKLVSENKNKVFSKADDLENKIQELRKERIKLQTEKIEYNKWLRETARDELITEKICETINNLSPMRVPNYIEPKHNDKAYCLIWGDEHFGVTFELRDLLGNIINSYNPEIFENRMWDLLNQVIEIIQRDNIDTLNVYSLGDFSDGCLRVSQLMKLKYGVVDGTIQYSNFITNWLNKLTEYVRVRYQMTNGNHTELRMLNQEKGTFTEDNMGKIVKEFIKIRLENNPNFTLIENPTGYIYDTLAGNTIMGIHGEIKNMERALKDFSKIHNVSIQYLIAGHLHHSKSEEIGVNSEVINIPSIVGVDTYSLSLNKTSNASGKLLVFEEGKGKICEYSLKLN
ncbi:Uncharacterised protein [uncultured Ruminococcus sp.]|nr:Uncharacterised protein [uncultured Ruminococcus sp.]